MFKRFLFVMLVMLLIVPIVGAQDDVFCGDLSADDCDLLVQSGKAMQEVESVGFALNASFELTGLGNELGADPLALGLVGDGHIAADMSKFSAMQGTNPADSLAMMDKLPDLFVDLLTNMQADMKFEISIPEQFMSPGMPELKFDIIMLDGIIYLDAGPLSGMSEPMWMGLDLASFYGGLLEDTMGQMGDMDLSAFADLSFDQNEYTTITRMDDETVMGQTVAVFVTKVDYGALMSSESMQQYFMDIMAASLNAQGMDMDDMGMDSQQFTDLMVAMFEDATFATTSWVGFEDKYVHHVGMTMTINLDMAMLAEAMGEAMTSDMPENIGFSFSLDLDVNDFNEPLDIIAPEGAMMIDPGMFGM